MIPKRPRGASWLRITTFGDGTIRMEWHLARDEPDNLLEEGERWAGTGRQMLFDFPLLFGYSIGRSTATVYYVHKDLLR